MSFDVRPTLGAAFAGCMIAVGLSAVLGFQTFLYFLIFPSDAFRYKALVGWIWLTDAVHTILICTTMWRFLIEGFGNPDVVKIIFPTIAITVAMTAIITLSVNSFYAWRIHRMSKRNWWLTGPILNISQAFLSIVRVGLAFCEFYNSLESLVHTHLRHAATTTEMMITKTFPVFAAKFKILFTSGLFVSAVTDIIVSAARYYYLRNLKQGYSRTQEVVDAVMVFTINDGILTCAVVITSIICWLALPHNFVYLGIYFTIAKFYSNSVLATLNLRNWYRWTRPVGIPIRANGANDGSSHRLQPISTTNKHDAIDDDRMEVFVDRQVEFNVAELIRADTEVPENMSRKSPEMSSSAV
ncbi:hypothetical protein BT96DRAFT_947475 [Gymnopus androsaceus JB14]|uniref:DUF6534 domain-containing protein n=1 Tax=Gymnopus androsaceus JB14 TaxID=1447944 RepID=A0A6A4GTV8_9AGAR|nr:hypothetical protein BT96DRAFT_947475 [Gymnopus androsaceus JB14]